MLQAKSLATNQKRPRVWCDPEVCSNSFFKWNPIASGCWLQVVSKMSQRLALVGPPTRTRHICMIIVKQSTLVTSNLLLIITKLILLGFLRFKNLCVYKCIWKSQDPPSFKHMSSLVSVPRSEPHHAPLKYRCPIKINNWITSPRTTPFSGITLKYI